MEEALEEMDSRLRAPSADFTRRIRTGWEVLDEVLGGGLSAGDLLLMGGPPGVGKTISALQWARSAAKEGHRAVFVCYEHDPATLLARLLILEAGEVGDDRGVGRALQDALAAGDVRGARLEDALEAVPGGQEALRRLRGYADRLILVRALGAHTSLVELRELLEASRRPNEQCVLFVDYLQKIPLLPEPEHESEKVTRSIEGLKDLALETRTPVVVLSAVETAGLEVGRLRMHHLRGSSAVAFESDVVLMLNDKHKAVSKVHLSYDNRAARGFRDWVVFSIEKNRGGPNLIDLEFRKDFAQFRFDPEGGIVSERLIDERLDEHDL